MARERASPLPGHLHHILGRDRPILRLALCPALLRRVAKELGREDAEIELRPRLGFRDARIDAIGSAIKADLEADVPADLLYSDMLANALAVRLIEISHPHALHAEASRTSGLSARRLKALTDFIEANLNQQLRLADLAAVAGIGATRLKALFRDSMGMPVHQYVIRRRIEYTHVLITTTTTPVSQIALAAGFAHQSHMASTMRRILGQTPSQIARLLPEDRPKSPGTA